MLGAFSSDVNKQADSSKTTASSSTEILITGSTTVQPISEELGKAYEALHQGVHINVQGGGSGAGVTAIGMKVCDIGSASRPIKAAEMTKYPTLKTYEIGRCAAVFIVPTATGLTTAAQGDIATAYNKTSQSFANTLITITSTVSRSDSSGTQDVVSAWLGSEHSAFTMNGTTAVPGSQAMEDTVATTANSIGFVDWAFACNDNRVKILNLTGSVDIVNGNKVTQAGTFTTSAASILAEAKSKDGKSYPEALMQPLNYITNGEPTTLVKSYIDYAMSPDGSTIIQKQNCFGVTQY
jgi:phosphate transport system substrate-binding protein